MGYNHNGQLCIGTVDNDYHNPTKIEFILDIPIKYISVGVIMQQLLIMIITYIWGRNNWGQLGLGYRVDRYSPIIIEYLTDKKVGKIYCKTLHTYALTQNGEVYSWGINNDGTPIKLNFPNNTNIKKLYIGNYHAFTIDTCSKIYSWGDNHYYQICGGDNIYKKSPAIANMLEDFNIKKILCMIDSTIILADNKLYSIGYGNYGELGSGIKETKEITLIAEGVDNVWGNAHTVFCKMCNGDIYTWGSNQHGQLGIGNRLNQKTPVRLNIKLDIKNINYFGNVTYAITTSGEIYTWGLNEVVNKGSITEPTIFTYFLDNNIEIKSMNRTKSAIKN